MSIRDNFSKPTIDTLSRRAGHLCSNPSCRKHTSGPNSNDNKSTTIGAAAHITAAAPGGPRYDNNLSSAERSHINNGIWLCSNCASLIDKDEAAYPAELLKLWKAQVELEMSNALAGRHQTNVKKEVPIIEAELIRGSTLGHSVGYSQSYQLEWMLKLVIRNNSSFPAYHLKLRFKDPSKIRFKTTLLNRSNLVPFGEWELEVSTQLQFQGDGLMADSYLQYRLPRHLNGMSIEIHYKDEARNDYLTFVTIKDDEVINFLNK